LDRKNDEREYDARAREPIHLTDQQTPVLSTGSLAPSPRLLTVRRMTIDRDVCPVRQGDHHMMFRSRESHDLRLVRTRLSISPEPWSLRWLHDVFDNSMTIMSSDTEATELVFDRELTLEHIEAPHSDYALDGNGGRVAGEQ